MNVQKENLFANLQSYRSAAEEREEQQLHPKAAFSKHHSRFIEEEKDHRLPYKRDVDRIVHSKAYARYADKTQVVYLVDNDHITHRALHVQLVSNFARGIAEILHLNGDLVEAIALGHDVGHPPFGHEGELYLSELALEHGQQAFAHSEQSCHLFTDLESKNLGFAVYDGFLCHDGGLSGTKIFPNFAKTWEEYFRQRANKRQDPDSNFMPATLEGCLVKLCDTVSYLGRDIEDAIYLKILSRDQLPKTLLGNSNGTILTAVAQSIIKSSYGQDYIAIDEEVYEAIAAFRKFNFDHIYMHPKLKQESFKIKRSYRYLFETLLEDWRQQKQKSVLWKSFLHDKSEHYLSKSSDIQKVVDYIAGMTDSCFVRTLEKLLLPRRIEI